MQARDDGFVEEFPCRGLKEADMKCDGVYVPPEQLCGRYICKHPRSEHHGFGACFSRGCQCCRSFLSIPEKELDRLRAEFRMASK